MIRSILIATAFTLALVTSSLAAPREVKISEEAIGQTSVLAPETEPVSFVALLSDAKGLGDADRAVAERLVASGAAVLLVDTPKLVEGLANGDEDECHYAFGDIEDAARTAQRALGMKQWRWPVMLGLGDTGGSLAYLTLAQAPLNTAAGAVSIGFTDSFASKLKICAGAPSTKVSDGHWQYGPMKALPGRWTLVTAAAPDATARAFLDESKETDGVVVAGSDEARVDAGIEATIAIGAPPPEELGDLPLVELPTDGPPVGLVVFLSGDGGWRDIDKSIGEILQKEGVAVVGIDSLRYFWSAKEPAVIAADLERIIAHYSKLWGAQRVAVVGYSLGADVIPFAWQRLTPETQKRVDLLALLGLEPTANFEVSVAGWLGVASSSDVDVRPYLPSLPAERTMCFYGREEVEDQETACVLSEMAKSTLVERPGGHHFDGDYEPVARMILDRLKTKEAAR
jgi:type IV secretory pathway VirJ component